jgi:hypothetical protein
MPRRSEEAKARAARKKMEIERARAIAGDEFLELDFNRQVKEVIEFINDLEPSIGCTKKFPNRNSFDFIRCGFQKFLLEHDASKLKQFGVPTQVQELR